VVGGVVGDLQRARVGQADVFPGHAHDAARQVFGVGAAVEHAAQPVQGRVRMRAAHRFVQGRDLVVEIVAALVEAARVQGQRVVDEFARDRGDAEVSAEVLVCSSRFRKRRASPSA
jgi:hypothetical protein